MKDVTGKASVKIPADVDHPDAGKKLVKEFDYQECETVDEAVKLAEEKGWTLLDFVNTELKNAARTAVYQNTLAAYKPSTVSPDEIKARMVRDFIRLGLPEEVAKAQVESILSQNNG